LKEHWVDISDDKKDESFEGEFFIYLEVGFGQGSHAYKNTQGNEEVAMHSYFQRTSEGIIMTSWSIGKAL